jgi:hypothetical protein
MDKEKREKLKGRIMIAELAILILLFFIIRPIFTGNTINESTNQTSCKVAWQSCSSNVDCCSGLSCLGGTCKTSSTTNQTTNQTAANNQTINQTSCKVAWQSCSSNVDCCSGLSCQGGSCKIAITSNQTIILIINNSPSIPATCNAIGKSCISSKDCCEKLICTEGNCSEKKLTCVDSDGGINPYLKGHTSGFNEEGNYVLLINDNCTSNQEIDEFYCKNETVHFEVISCPNECEKGVCKCKSSNQSCSSSLECCSGFNCINKICTSTGIVQVSLKNKALCTFIGYSCEANEDCCSKNCIPTQQFLFWKSETKKCGEAKLNKTGSA